MWRACREMAVPDSLARRIALFRDRAHVWLAEDELFRLDSWIHVMLGQGIEPRRHHPVTRAISDADLCRLLDSVRGGLAPAVAAMPQHQQFLQQYCAAGSDVWERARRPAR
jgi:tryptophan halogenase